MARDRQRKKPPPRKAAPAPPLKPGVTRWSIPALTAPPGKYRIVGIDKFEPPGAGHFVMGDCASLEDALALARTLGREEAPLATDPSIATVFYVYDDRGVYRGGDIYAGE